MSATQSSRVRWLLLIALLFAISWFTTDKLALPSGDKSDEAEWTAISAVHYRQLLGTPPPGISIDEERDKLHEDNWRQGVQGTTFGWPNPGLNKWLWGMASDSVVPLEIDPALFFRYHRGNLGQANAAVVGFDRAIERNRRLVALASAGCAVLLFLIAKRVSGSTAGFIAYALWLGHPLIRQWSHQARPDFTMAFLLFATVLATMHGAAAMRGECGPLRRWLAMLGIGLLAGLAVGTKLNGALAGIFVAFAIPIVFIGRQAPGRWKSVLLTWAFCGSVIALTFWACFPYLWSQPLDHLSDVLAFWKKHMALQQNNWEAAGGIATRTMTERWDLVLERLTQNYEPVGASIGLPGGMLWLLLSALAVGALTADKDLGNRSEARLLALASVVVLIGTTAWLPLDWDRYFFPSVGCLALAEGVLLGTLASMVIARVRRASDAASDRP
ncbi:MAG: hypothetical protein ACI8X5_001846 [Planctomycetota bacterium]|jgi:hypothetical protein